MSSLEDAQLIDIHTHYQPRGWVKPSAAASPVGGFSADVLQDLDGLVAESDEAGVDVRALSAPVESLFGPAVDEDDVPETTRVNAVNEFLADALRDHGGRLVGLATVDAYSGEAGAEQARHAVEELGLHGIVLDSSRYGRYLSSPQAFPTLELAARLQVPVFVHPVAAPQAARLIEVAGRPGNSIGRGLQNGVAFLSALHADLPSRLPGLHLVFTSLGNGAVHFAVGQLAEYRTRNEDGLGANIYFDTTRFNAPLIRYFGEVLGPERILVGSDWPGRHDATRANVDATLAAAGFDAEQQELVRVGNARRLLQLRTAKVEAAA